MITGNSRTKVINIAWVFFGLVFAFSATGFFLSGSGTIYNFYNVGDVYEIESFFFNRNNLQENGHQEPSGEVILDKGSYRYDINIVNNKNKWGFFCLDLDNVHSAYLYADFYFLIIEDGITITQERIRADLKKGINLIKLPQNSFNYIYIYIYGEHGDSYIVKKMQMRENEPVFTWEMAVRIYIIAFAVYSLVSCLLLLIWRKLKLKCRPYRWMEVLQDLYISIAAKLYDSVSKAPCLMKGRRGIRTFLFAFMFVYNAVIDMQGTFDAKFNTHLIIYLVILLLITVFSVEPGLKKQNWNHALAWGWLGLWVMACVSDFLVSKNYRFLGYVMILVVGLFFFVWNNMENRQEIVGDFVRAVHIFLMLAVVFCFLFRPETEGMRYSGISGNPSVFAMYFGVVWAVALGEIEQNLRARKSVIRMFPYIIEGCVVMAFCWKAQAIGPMLYMFVVAFVWFLRVICYTKRTRTQWKAVLAVLSFLFLIVPVYAATDWGINNIPQAVGSPIAFEDDHPVVYRELGTVVRAEEAADTGDAGAVADAAGAADAGTVADTASAVGAADAGTVTETVDTADAGAAVDAAAATDAAQSTEESAVSLWDRFAETRLGQKLASLSLSRILSSRDYYYRAYLRNMNLFGHKKNPKLWGKRRLPHNAILGIAYRYGVFAAVPYILMLGAVLIRTFRYGNRNVKYAGMPFLICLISILMSMTDNVELPFRWLPWIALYLMMGAVFADDGQAVSQEQG